MTGFLPLKGHWVTRHNTTAFGDEDQSFYVEEHGAAVGLSVAVDSIKMVEPCKEVKGRVFVELKDGRDFATTLPLPEPTPVPVLP